MKKALSVLILVLSVIFVTACGNKEQEEIKKILDDVKITYANGDDWQNVTTNLTLPTTLGNAVIAWSSSDVAIISNTGVVTRPVDENKTVTLTATAVIGTSASSKEFAVIVLKIGTSGGTPVTGEELVVSLDFSSSNIDISYSTTAALASATVKNSVNNQNIILNGVNYAKLDDNKLSNANGVKISGAYRNGSTEGYLELDFGTNISSITFNAAFYTANDLTSATGVFIEVKNGTTWTLVRDITSSINETEQAVELDNLSGQVFRIRVTGTSYINNNGDTQTTARICVIDIKAYS